MLIGKIGQEIKLSYFDKENCIGRFVLSTDESYIDKNGQKTSALQWHTIVLRNKQAEVFEQYTQKGDTVYVEGKIRTRNWTDEQGVRHAQAEIIAHDFTLLSSSKNEP